MGVSFDSLDVIPVIPSRGLSWNKVYGLTVLAGVGIGAAIGAGTWGGIENGNKNAMFIERVNLETQAQNLKAQVEQKDAEMKIKAQEFEDKKEDFKKQAERDARNELYNSGELGWEWREQDIREILGNSDWFRGRRLKFWTPGTINSINSRKILQKRQTDLNYQRRWR